MAISPTVLTVFIAGHLSVVATTFLRLASRSIYFFIWADDILAAVTAGADVVLLVRLILLALARAGTSFHYRLDFAISFLVLWASRATLVMAPTRVHKDSNPHVLWASIFTSLFLIFGVFYGILAFLFCSTAPDCQDDTLCICYPPYPLLIFAFITELVVNAGLLYRIRRLLVRDPRRPFRTMNFRLCLAVLGFCSNVFVLITSAVCLAVYLARSPHDSILLVYVINTVTMISVFTTNVSVIIGFFSQQISVHATNIQQELPLTVRLPTVVTFDDHTKEQASVPVDDLQSNTSAESLPKM